MDTLLSFDAAARVNKPLNEINQLALELASVNKSLKQGVCPVYLPRLGPAEHRSVDTACLVNPAGKS